ncbi:putative membrane channel-forming protein YqfA (hemolysin III family) [Lewinella marina]|uniref:Uncharacterized protein n=1 Tax=Neolewinella marina TaxID=438751 RepID=A0A2G0CBC6_9BACT|nr:hypothetical protein [Neolewinella marina]NJB87825.1 putative membrane channel-forming protein YqfA (hemolysin III family) [Neolewinella marina]PHK97288.1 hypothetical protein CGL56_17070 [Neolewinella marina]
MDILKAATDWGKAEVFSAQFFILFGVLFLLASAGFWQLGKTDLARAYVVPVLVAGVLLLVIGLGLYFTNQSRLTNFAAAYDSDASAFVEAEIARTERTLKEYQLVVLKVIPLIIVVAALLIVFLDQPNWRAISITCIAMMAVILLIDTNAHARIEAYHGQLEMALVQLKS